jgi:hypothetical protein
LPTFTYLRRYLFEYKIQNVGYENRLIPTVFVKTLSVKIIITLAVE